MELSGWPPSRLPLLPQLGVPQELPEPAPAPHWPPELEPPNWRGEGEEVGREGRAASTRLAAALAAAPGGAAAALELRGGVAARGGVAGHVVCADVTRERLGEAGQP